MYTSIQIDTELDDDLFSLEPPDGYTLSVAESGWPEGKEKMAAKVMHMLVMCLVYADKHDDQFPNELADIVTAGIMTDKVLKNVLAAPDDPGGPPVFRYRRPDTDTGDWSDEVVLYEIYEEWPDDGVVACFGDGHCGLIRDQNRFEESIR